MTVRLFLIAAIILLAFAIAASAAADLTFLTVSWTTWLCAGLVSWAVDHLFGGVPVSGRQPPV